jgi:hypothetical protein
VNQFPFKPLIPTPVAILLILLLLAVKWVYFPDDEFDFGEEHPSLAIGPPPEPVVHPLALEAALAAANRWPVKAVVVLVMPCDEPARPMLIGARAHPSTSETTRYCVVQLDTE